MPSKDWRINAKVESNIPTGSQVSKEQLLIKLIEKSAKSFIQRKTYNPYVYYQVGLKNGYKKACAECIDLIKLHTTDLLKIVEGRE